MVVGITGLNVDAFVVANDQKCDDCQEDGFDDDEQSEILRKGRGTCWYIRGE